MKRIIVTLAILTLAALPVLAGEWHTGQNNLCADCHTMHNSMSHGWNGTDAVTIGTPSKDGNWVGVAGPAGDYLLKAKDPNALCLSCHNNQTFAPSVTSSKTANDASNRSAGFLNTGEEPSHTGHTIGEGSKGMTAPGGTFTANADHGLECINCHTQHGRAGVYRNLGPRTGPVAVPQYAIKGRPAWETTRPGDLEGAISNGTIDVFIDVEGYTPNTNNFAAYYETANIKYLKRSAPVGGIENASGTQCGFCHGNFHGGPTSGNIGGELAANGTSYVHFNRHPVGGVVIGGTGQGGYSPNPTTRYSAAAAVSRIKVYANQADFSDATPGCISCHKAHGNGQPFGLIFANRTLPGMGEDGNLPVPTDGKSTAIAQRGLCGQCHGQGN